MGKLNLLLAVRVAARRRALNLSQEELAAAAELHRTYVGSVERGEANVTLYTLEKLAAALNETPCQLICDEVA